MSSSRISITLLLCTVPLIFILASITLTSPSWSSPQPPPTAAPCPSSPPDPNVTRHHKDTPLAPSPLPPPHHASDSSLIIPLLLSLSRSSTWTSIANISLSAPDTFEPEGLLILHPDRLVVSAAEYTSPTTNQPDGTRSPGSGFAHLLVFDTPSGTLLADTSLNHPLSLEYHNGGIDYDGSSIYVVLSQRRPSSSATIYAVDPNTLLPTPVLHHPNDHLGTVIINPLRRLITALNWGSRVAASFVLPTTAECTSQLPVSVVNNPSHMVDYQDCKFLGPHDGRDVALCSGVTSLPPDPHQQEHQSRGYSLGGIALVYLDTMTPLFDLPITLESASGMRMTQNPFDVAVKDGRLRFYWAPDQHETTLYVYEVQP